MELKKLLTLFTIIISINTSAMSLRNNISYSFFSRTIIPYSTTISTLYSKILKTTKKNLNAKSIIKKTKGLHKQDIYLNFYFDVIKPLQHIVKKKSLKELKKVPLEQINFRINEMSMILSKDKKVPKEHRVLAKKIHNLWNLLLMNIIKS